MSKSNHLKFGLIGCGAIGTAIAQAILSGKIPGKLAAIYDQDRIQAKNLSSRFGIKLSILPLAKLVGKVDFLIEAASTKAVPEVLREAIKQKKDLLIMSVGGLLENLGLLEKISARGIKIYLPSGAIAGLDGIKSAAVGRIDRLTLTTRKPPESLANSAYFRENKIDWKKIKKPELVFQGDAQSAVKSFPANINVAATLSLAVPGNKLQVKIIADPAIKRNIHEITVKGGFGEMLVRVENVPSKENPKTSQLAIFAAIASLQQITKNIHIGG
ncbi:MAG: aspartate dehydrogenase [Elusimicrobiota bacterium]